MRRPPNTAQNQQWRRVYLNARQKLGYTSVAAFQRRRGELIDKNVFHGDGLTDDEAKELEQLQRLVNLHVRYITNDQRGRDAKRTERLFNKVMEGAGK